MLAGMAYEIEAQWRPDTDAVTARDLESRRAAAESRATRGSASGRVARPRLLDRVVASVQTWTRIRPAA